MHPEDVGENIHDVKQISGSVRKPGARLGRRKKEMQERVGKTGNESLPRGVHTAVGLSGDWWFIGDWRVGWPTSSVPAAAAATGPQQDHILEPPDRQAPFAAAARSITHVRNAKKIEKDGGLPG